MHSLFSNFSKVHYILFVGTSALDRLERRQILDLPTMFTEFFVSNSAADVPCCKQLFIQHRITILARKLPWSF